MDSSRLVKGRIPMLPLPGVVVDAGAPPGAGGTANVANTIAKAVPEQPYESAINALQFPALQISGYLSAYATQQRWRAIDVYLDLSQFQVQGASVGIGFVTCAIYAVNQGMRVLVGQHRTQFDEIARSK